MNIGKNWKIEADSLNIILLQKTGRVKATDKKPAHDRWEKSYYSGVENALKALVDKGVRDTQLIDLETVVKKQNELYALIDGLPKVTTSSMRVERKKKGSED